MKKLHLIAVSLLALVFGRPAGLCTANAKAAAEAPENPEADAPKAPEDHSPLALQCRGAGVDPADVRWRVQAGLDLDQAVQAAIAQKESDAQRGKKK